MKKLMAFAGSLSKSFIVTVLLLLNAVNVFILEKPLWLGMVLLFAILLFAATLVMHTLQKSNEARDRFEANRMDRF